MTVPTHRLDSGLPQLGWPSHVAARRRDSSDQHVYAAASARATGIGNAQRSTTAMSALHVGDSGAYGELVKRPLPEGLSLVFVPSLAALLMRAQQLNDGAAL